MAAKKNILVSAAGTATAWHISNVIVSDFSQYFNLFVCDINPPHLIPASTLSEKYFQVPRVDSKGYRAHMLELFKKNNVDVFIPLIDHDVYGFTTDDSDLLESNTTSTSVSSRVADLLCDKSRLSDYLEKNDISVPKRFSRQEDISEDVFMKPVLGFGSRNVKRLEPSEINENLDFSKYIFQEICEGPEITVEVFNSKNQVFTICRERIETKEGVCTKAKINHNVELHELAEKIISVIEMPVSFCFQVMKNKSGEWVVIDLNPRIGAGTALSTKAGWSLVKAQLAVLAGLDERAKTYLSKVDKDTFVARVYQEVLMS